MSGCATYHDYVGDYMRNELAKKEQEKLEDEVRLNTWIGENEKSLMDVWGQPSLIFLPSWMADGRPELKIAPELKSALSEGKKVLIYYGHCKAWLDASSQVTSYSGQIGDTPFSATSTTRGEEKIIDFPWEIDFIIDKNGKIEKWFNHRPYFRGAYPPSIPTADKVKQQGNP